MKKGDLFIGSISKTTGAFSAAVQPASHTNFLSASKEAERLGKKDLTKKFVVLEVKGIYTAPVPQPVGWE